MQNIFYFLLLSFYYFSTQKTLGSKQVIGATGQLTGKQAQRPGRRGSKLVVKKSGGT